MTKHAKTLVDKKELAALRQDAEDIADLRKFLRSTFPDEYSLGGSEVYAAKDLLMNLANARQIIREQREEDELRLKQMGESKLEKHAAGLPFIVGCFAGILGTVFGYGIATFFKWLAS